MKRLWILIVGAFLLLTVVGLVQGRRASAIQKGLARAQIDGTIVRTLVYHEITTLVGQGVDRSYPMISGDGSRLVYSVTANDASRVYVAKFDGSELREVATYNNISFNRFTDLSYDGSKVMTCLNYRIHVIGADGSNPVTVWDKGGLNDNIRLAPLGDLVFFEIRNDYYEYPRGLWVIGAGGGTARRIVTPEEVSGVVGVPAGEISFDSGNTRALDVSNDGSRVIFTVDARGRYVLGGNYNPNGSLTGLHKILGPVSYYNLHNVVISADGSTVGYVVTQENSGDFEAGIVGFDGTGKKTIVKSNEIKPPAEFPSGSVASRRIFLNHDGSRLLLGATSYFYDTPTGSVLQLAVEIPAYSGETPKLVAGGMFVPSMSASGTRFSYLRADANNLEQLATAEITTTLGSAPNLSNPTIDPVFLLTNGRSATTLTVRATAGTGVNRVSAAIMRNGLDEELIGDVGPAKPVLLPTGNDVYANSGVRDRGSNTQPGPRLVRFQAETKTGDNKRHATAIDAESLTLTEQTPLIDVAPTSLEFGDVGVGQSKDLTLVIRNIGGVSLTINSLSIDNARFSLPSTAAPFTLAAGESRNVTVRFAPTATGQQRGTLTIGCSDPVRPTVTVALAGNGIVSSCTYSINPGSQNFSAAGGNGSVTVTTQSGCQWAATSNAGWITVTGGSPGSGNGTVNFQVAANTGAARSGTITIANQTFTVNQEAGTSPCTYTILPNSQSFPAGGGTGIVNVTTQSGCQWTGTSNDGWIVVTGGSPGNGNGTLNYSVAANAAADSRNGTMIVAGLTFTVTQAGSVAGGPIIRIEPNTLNFNVQQGQSSSLTKMTRDLAGNDRASREIVTQRIDEKEKEGEEEVEKIRGYREWFYRQREYPMGRIPEGARMRAVEEKNAAIDLMRAAAIDGVNAGADAQWKFLGPSSTASGSWTKVSGRVSTIAVHPTNPNIVYIGGAQGGVWRTTDNGDSWTPLTDNQPSLAMGSIAIDPGNPNIIYAGTGEQHFSDDSYYGNGLLKSTDGGVTWIVLGTSIFSRQTISRVVVCEGNTQQILASASNGLYRSLDGGDNWNILFNGTVTDVLTMPGNSATWYVAGYRSGVWKTSSNGANWVKLTNGLPASNFTRVHLSISTGAPNTLLAVFVREDGQLEGLYRTTDGGANWSRIQNAPNAFGNQGWYDVSLAIHPTDSNIMYLGGVMLWRSRDGGTTWSNISNPTDYFKEVHPDHHALAFNPQNPSVVWLGCDGGIWRSDNGGDTWSNRNEGLGLAQFYKVGLHPTDDTIAAAGAQDNGFQKFTGNTAWQETLTGDYGTVLFDFNSPSTIYTTAQYGRFSKSTSSGAPGSWTVNLNGIPVTDGRADNRVSFISMFAMDPTNPQKLAFASYRVWQTSDGAGSWTAISGDLTGGAWISDVAYAAGGARIWTGSADALIWRGDSSGGSWSWTNVTKSPLPNRYVTRIAPHPSDPNIAYISYSGFGGDHIYKTTDGGMTWTVAGGGLPDIPVNAALVDPNNPTTVYAGTDVGVYRSTDQGQNWTPFGTGLPTVAVFDLAIRKNGALLRAATHGRGLWEVPTSAEQSFTIFNDGDATLTVTGIDKQNNAGWLSFTTLSSIPIDIPPKSSTPVRVGVNATGLAAGVYTERLLVTSNDAARSPYPTGVYINLNVSGQGGGGGCTYDVTPLSRNFGPGGGSGSIAVTTPNGCTWTSSTLSAWITITGGESGNGNGNVNYSVAANTTATPRVGSIKIGGKNVEITQDGGSNCTFSLSRTFQSFEAAGGNGSVDVTTQAGCNWSASSNADWIAVTSGRGGTGNGSVGFLVAVNNSTAQRSGTITIANQTLIVAQNGGGSCTFTLKPNFQVFPAAGGTGSFAVETQGSCNWTATLGTGEWATIASGGSGKGNGTVNFTVAANPATTVRGDSILVGGQYFLIGQLGTGSTCGLFPIGIGQTVEGVLQTTDCRSPIYGADYLADLWYFYAPAGQQVAIKQTSSEFNAYITLIGPDATPYDEDDNGAGGTDSRIPPNSGYITLDQAGVYIIEASTALKNEAGKYTLSLTAPVGCTYVVSPASLSFGAAGGNGAVNVATQANCVWSAVSNTEWISFASGGSGSNSGPVNIAVAANTGANTRIGTLTVAGQTVTVTQSGGSNCTFGISPTSQNVAVGGGNGTVNVTTQAGCNWTAKSQANWIAITAGSSGSGNGAVSFTASANNGPARTGTIVIGGQTFTVNQAENPACTYSLSPAARNIDSAGGTGSVQVNTQTGCNWAATTNVNWITFQLGTDKGNGAGSFGYQVAMNNSGSPRQGVVTVHGQTFTINQTAAGGRIVRVLCTSGMPGGTLTVPIELLSQGDENALSFSLTFDPAVLGNPQATKGSAASAAILNLNANQAAQGRFGVALALPTGQTFAAGARQIVVVTFAISPSTTVTTTTIGFGDAPILRRVANADAQVLNAVYQSDSCATVPLLKGYEADIMPRPNGKNDGTVSINDWVMIGRFAAALDTPAAGSEFQRADCAPRNVKGDGLVAIDDWVQAGRYYAALDQVQTIGGPAGPATLRWNAGFDWRGANLAPAIWEPSARVSAPTFPNQVTRTLRAVNTVFIRGQNATLSIELNSQGNENAVGFSLDYNPAMLTYISAAVGSDAANGFLIVNSSQTNAGRLGLAVALPAGEKFSAGARQIITVQFSVANNPAANMTIGFGDQPVQRQIADVNAGTLTANYTDGAMTLANLATGVSSANYFTPLTSEMIASLFSTGMATGQFFSVPGQPLPTNLGGTEVEVVDAFGVIRIAPLFYVDPQQVNFLVPKNTTLGQTTITVKQSGNIVAQGKAMVDTYSPGLFAANGDAKGIAAAFALRFKGTQYTYESVAQWNPANLRWEPLPIDLGPETDQIYLVLFGTGIRGVSGLNAVQVTVGGVSLPVLYAGVSPDYFGLDQVNVGPIPRTFIGRGSVDIVFTGDMKTANALSVTIK